MIFNVYMHDDVFVTLQIPIRVHESVPTFTLSRLLGKAVATDGRLDF